MFSCSRGVPSAACGDADCSIPKIEEWANLTNVSVALKGRRGGRHGY